MENKGNGLRTFSGNHNIMTKNDKNSLDFWRIIFTYLIVALHYGYSIGWKLGVEFFFILSGMLLAAECTVKKTGFRQYVWKRIRRLYPHYIFSFIVFVLILDNGGGIMGLLQVLRKSLLEICMLQIIGIGDYASNHGAVWYVSSLFISSVFLYGCMKFLSYKVHLFIFLVFIALGYFSQFLFGSMCITTWESPLGFCLLPGLIRGLSEMSLGILCFYIGRMLDERGMWRKKREFLIGMEILSMSFIVLYTYKHLDNHVLILALFCIAVTTGYFCEHGLLSHALIKKFSLFTYPVYLNHPIWLIILGNHCPIFIVLLVVTFYSVITYYILKKLDKLFRKEKAA